MTDLQIIERLIARDEVVTQQFFYKDCRPLFRSVIYNVFQNKVEYDELINELYLYLMENDAYRLKQFEGRSSLFQWIKVVAIRYFIEKRDQVIEKESVPPSSQNALSKKTQALIWQNTSLTRSLVFAR